MPQFLEQHVRATWKMLSVPNFYLQVRCIPGDAKGALIDNEEAFVAWAKANNGKGNLFVGRNPRKADGSVAMIRCVSFDLDPVGNGGADDCRRAALDIVAAFPGGVLGFSGRGIHVYYVSGSPISSNLPAFERAYSTFNEQLSKTVLKSYEGTVKLDDLHDSARLDRVLGAVSTKVGGGLTRFLTLPSGRDNGERVFNRIKEISGGIPGPKGSDKSQPHVGDFQRVGPASGVLDQERGVGVGSAVDRETAGADPSELIPLGARDIYLTRIAGGLRRAGLGEEAIFQGLKAAYDTKCVHVPGEQGEVYSNLRNKARGFQRYEPAKIDFRQITGGNISGPSDLVNNNHGGLVAISVSTPADSLAAYEDILRKRSERKEPKFPTGFNSIDDKTEGFTEGDLFVVGANTGAGKSTWCVNAADHLLKRGTKVLLLSTELTRYQIFDKVFSLNTGLEYKKFRRGDFTSDERAQIDEFKKRFKEYPLVINDLLSPDIEQVRELVKKEKPEVLILDHIHQIGSGSTNLYGVLSRFTNDLKGVAESCKLPIVVAAQFSRPERMMDKETGDVKIARKPTLYDFKACGEIENRASTALLLYDTKESVDLNVNKIGADIAKCREGERGFVEIGWKWRTNLMQEVG